MAYQENYTAIETLFVASVGPALGVWKGGDNIMNHKVGVITYSRKKWHKMGRAGKAGPGSVLELSKNPLKVSQCPEKVPTEAFSLLKAY